MLHNMIPTASLRGRVKIPRKSVAYLNQSMNGALTGAMMESAGCVTRRGGMSGPTVVSTSYTATKMHHHPRRQC